MALGVAMVAVPRLDAFSYSDSLYVGEYKFYMDSDPWLTSSNAAGLTRFSGKSLSDGRIFADYNSGGFCDYYEAPESVSFGGAVESILRLNKKTVLSGGIIYNHFNGSRMAGSAFINPDKKPFDIVEYDLSNLGRKERDTYNLYGAVGSALSRTVSSGFRMNYTSANYAKYKDLRHKNSLMDMTISAGLSWKPLQNLTIGTDAIYLRSIEILRFSIYGSEDRVYNSLISYTAFMGRKEQFGENGYTDKNNEMPFLDERFGADVQLEWNIIPGLNWFVSASWQDRSGYYGKKSTYTISYNEHKGDLKTVGTRLSLYGRSWRHVLEATYSVEKIQDYSNTYREVEKDNGARYYEYFTPVLRSAKTFTDISIDYSGAIGLRNGRPVWLIEAGVHGSDRKQTGYSHPYYRRQNLDTYAVSASVKRYFIMKKGILSTKVGTSFSEGSGSVYNDGLLAQPSSKQTPPPVMETYLYRNYEFLTAGLLGFNASVRYDITGLSAGLSPYLSLSGKYLFSTGDISYLENSHRTTLSLTLGCEF